MTFELYRPEIIPAKDAGLSTKELKLYLGVGRNSVAEIARRFGVEKMHGIYPEKVLWRQLFGVLPADDSTRSLLRESLVDINWVRKVTGVTNSTIRDNLRTGRWQYDRGVQLGDADAEQAPRMRRWLPALIRTRVLGSPVPSFEIVEPVPVPAPGSNPRCEPASPADAGDVFETLFASEAARPSNAENNNCQ
ncbi:MAG: hypothetical protein CML03_06425 [Pseudooceanicola sp.]|nr:hypothetical protein [Pseudooceanicola sp.]